MIEGFEVGLESFSYGSRRLLDNVFSPLSITVGAPAAIYAKLFV